MAVGKAVHDSYRQGFLLHLTLISNLLFYYSEKRKRNDFGGKGRKDTQQPDLHRGV
jgi:hypothetical protein